MSGGYLPEADIAFKDDKKKCLGPRRGLLHIAALLIGRAVKSFSMAPVVKGGRRRKTAVRVSGPYTAGLAVAVTQMKRPGQAPRAAIIPGAVRAQTSRARIQGWRAAGAPRWTGSWRKAAASHAALAARDAGAAVVKAGSLQREFLCEVRRPWRPGPTPTAVAAAAAMQAPGLAERSTGPKAVEAARWRSAVVPATTGPQRNVRLHSLAPVPRGTGTASPAQELNGQDDRARVRPDKVLPRRNTGGRESGEPDDRRISQALSDLLDRQARLPPSGVTGFDPRLSPAWPGLKLPA